MSAKNARHVSGASRVWSTIKHVIIFLFVIAIIFVGVVLAVENQQSIVVSLWLIETPAYPLVVWLVASFILGLIVGALIVFNSYLRERHRHRKDLVKASANTA